MAKILYSFYFPKFLQILIPRTVVENNGYIHAFRYRKSSNFRASLQPGYNRNQNSCRKIIKLIQKYVYEY